MQNLRMDPKLFVPAGAIIIAIKWLWMAFILFPSSWIMSWIIFAVEAHLLWRCIGFLIATKFDNKSEASQVMTVSVILAIVANMVVLPPTKLPWWPAVGIDFYLLYAALSIVAYRAKLNQIVREIQKQEK